MIIGLASLASVNYALRFQESATSPITPMGQCQAYLPYGEEGVLGAGNRGGTSDRSTGDAIRARASSRARVGVSLRR